MPRTKLLLTLLLLSGGHFIHAQNGTHYPKNQIKFSPLRLIDAISGVEFSYERVFVNKHPGRKPVATQLTFAHLDHLFYPEEYRKMKGFRISVEEKFFLSESRKVNPYFAVEIAYLSGKHPYQVGREDTVNRKVIDDSVVLKKETAAINFKYGFEILFKHFVIDVSAGIGYKYRHVQYLNAALPSLPIYEGARKHYDFGYQGRKEGTSYTMNVPLTLKIGITF